MHMLPWNSAGHTLFLFFASFTRYKSALCHLLCEVTCSDHVYFVHSSTDRSVDISTDTRPMYRSTYRPSAYQYVGRHISRVSVDRSTAMCRSTYRPMCQPRYRPSDGQHIDRLSADISADIAAGPWPIR